MAILDKVRIRPTRRPRPKVQTQPRIRQKEGMAKVQAKVQAKPEPKPRPRPSTKARASPELRAFQGHSADCGHNLEHMCGRISPAALRDMDREFQSPFLWHGTDLHAVPGIVREGVVPGTAVLKSAACG